MREAAAISVERRAIAVHAWRVQSAVRAYLELTGGKLADNAEEEQEHRAVCALRWRQGLRREMVSIACNMKQVIVDMCFVGQEVVMACLGRMQWLQASATDMQLPEPLQKLRGATVHKECLDINMALIQDALETVDAPSQELQEASGIRNFTLGLRAS